MASPITTHNYHIPSHNYKPSLALHYQFLPANRNILYILPLTMDNKSHQYQETRSSFPLKLVSDAKIRSPVPSLHKFITTFYILYRDSLYSTTNKIRGKEREAIYSKYFNSLLDYFKMLLLFYFTHEKVH